ncbi:DNA polymerase zeta catalytic subunit [Nasonia vitripennis]|uniref:DNA polymerase zeta catalytic subunit n=1 Tax=Nasonia vitripennis TaxID=7425 RepID=A0A7M7HG61_NASVI|nr:DNA polymerase zeta catalytic subunit [Nasonia vitripennis]
MYSVRLICADSYQATPIPEVDPTFSQFRGSDIKQVPVLRIFGTTQNGEKVCLHIHGVFPYLYVPYSGQIKADILAYRLAAALDTAINISLGSAKANTQHVYKVHQVSGIPFYGYHRKNHHFFKIYFYNPAMIKRATDLLQNGCILDQVFQPHEAHIPFTMQFMIDYNIYGMSMINLRNVKHRHSATVSQTEEKLSNNSNNLSDFESEVKEYLPYSVKKQSVCKLEIDAWASDILNREVIDKGMDLNPGIDAIWEEEKARRAQAGLVGESQLTHPSSPERSQAARILTDNDIYHQKRLAQRLCVIESQGDESSLSPNSQNSSYPLPVPDDSNLLNASRLEIHAGPLGTSAIQQSINQSDSDLNNESIMLSWQSQASFSDISLNSSDLEVVDLLANLAKDQEDIPSSIDSNSILGSQKSQRNLEDLGVEQDNPADVEDEGEEVTDLNLTNLELDLLNFSSWETNVDKSQPPSKTNESQIELVLESLNPHTPSRTDNIPQLDGPIDDENARTSAEDPDMTIERREFVICEYRQGRGGRRSTAVTPGKRKRVSSSDDDDSRGSEKKTKTKDSLPKTPRRSPSKRMNKLTSPSCPNRTYSPLSLEISCGQKTPKSSPLKSPTTRPFDRRKMREAFRRKRIFSPVKESNLEEEHDEGTSNASKKPSASIFDEKLNLPIPSNKSPSSESDEQLTPIIEQIHNSNESPSEALHDQASPLLLEQPHISPLDFASIKAPSEASEEQSPLKTPVDQPLVSPIDLASIKALSETSEPSSPTIEQRRISPVFGSMKKSSKTPLKLFISNLEQQHTSSSDSIPPSNQLGQEIFTFDMKTPDSDRTLVEDSDESLETLTPSSPENPAIINESDTNDTEGSQEKKSTLSSYNFPHDVLHTVAEKEEGSSLEFQVSFTQVEEVSEFMMTFTPTSIEHIENSSKSQKIPKPKEEELSDSSEDDENLDNKEEPKTPPGFGSWRNMEFTDNRQLGENQKTSDQGCSSSSKGTEFVMTFKPPSFEHIKNSAKSQEIPKSKEEELSDSSEDDENLNNKEDPKTPPGFGSWRKFTGNADTVFQFDEHEEGLIAIRPLYSPPSRESVESWLKAKEKREQKEKEEKEKVEKEMEKSSIATPDVSLSLSKIFHPEDFSHHLGVSCGQIEFNSRSSVVDIEDGNLGKAKALTTYQFLTVLCLDVHPITRPNLLPDPRQDRIAAVFYAIHNDVPPDWNQAKPLDCGVIIVDPEKVNSKIKKLNGGTEQEQSLIYVEKEEDVFEEVVSLIQRCDPEILIGWDIEFLSWGYLFQRASVFGKNLSGKISRIPSAKCNWETRAHDESTTELHLETLVEVKLPGRIVLDIWRIMRSEIALTGYTYENVMYNVMNERIPNPSFDTLTKWWNSSNTQWRVIDNYSNKVIGVHRLLHHLDIINRTSEHARLYGIQFYEVFSRGSQFRVESMMLRLAKPMNYIAVSPSAHQRGCMRAPESLPLIMEPESTMYLDPVVVLDFQSLYPSIIIAYNYCFSTCLGRIEHIGSPHPFEFGATTLKVQKNLAKKLQNKMNFAPCGVAFVKSDVRRGILPRMLTEILETRLMVKKAIKDHSKEDRALQRALHSRQLGLKLIANVTYGYTAANFSGRMPCIEVGDSVVSKGKETLERAIKMVESTPEWGARVVYGDTDSLFILLKGKTREEAFAIGAEMADAVTAANPKPVKLKFEKVMQPCILQTKKRYCGYMYENLNDKPVYLAKGIETVRRDGCPAVAKILEKSLRILFDTNNMSMVKQYVTRQLDKVLSGRASIQDLTFAKEFRGMKGYKAAACVPALELTKRLIQKDPRAVPRTGARVPYIIVAGAPNEALIRCVRAPMELILDPGLRPNATYYVTKVIIPPLNRCLKLIGVDAYTWYMEMPHRQALNRLQGPALLNANRKQKTTISQYLCNATCPSCGQSCDRGICAECVNNQSQTLVVLHEKCRQYERIYSNIKMLCESCIGVKDADSCTSLDCPIFYRRSQAQRDNTQTSYLYNLMQCMEHLN